MRTEDEAGGAWETFGSSELMWDTYTPAGPRTLYPSEVHLEEKTRRGEIRPPTLQLGGGPGQMKQRPLPGGGGEC